MISVAMATYNSKDYIIKQLDSIYRQTKPIDELIIQDDCSKDDTVEIIKSYITKNNIKNIYIKINEHNMGYISTFKKAIERSSGDIIILCDHDDIWLNDKVEKIYNTFSKNEEIIALATSFMKIDENDVEIKSKNHLFHANNDLIRHRIINGKLNKMSFKDVAVFNISPGCTCAFKNNIKNELLSNTYNIPHDLQIMILASLKNGLYYLDEITTKYRIYSSNTIGLGHQTKYEKRMDIVKKGMQEKNDLLSLCRDQKADLNTTRLMNRIIMVYENRVKMLESCNLFRYFLKTFILSLGLNKLYESVAFDMLTILKRKEEK